jgi:hypothetical protein
LIALQAKVLVIKPERSVVGCPFCNVNASFQHCTHNMHRLL